MKKFLSIAIALLALPTHAQNLTINDFEKIGFIKENQPLFQMVGAIDGWKGKFKGNQIEVYLYESKSKIQRRGIRVSPRIHTNDPTKSPSKGLLVGPIHMYFNVWVMQRI